MFRESRGGSLLGGCFEGSGSSATLFVGLNGSDGLGGILGAESRPTAGGARNGTAGADFVEIRGTFVARPLSSSSRRVGGNGGSFA